jgi:hypothetical protein
VRVARYASPPDGRERTSPDAQRTLWLAFGGAVPQHCSVMRDISSPVPDPADAGRGALHALQALLLGLFVLLIL